MTKRTKVMAKWSSDLRTKYLVALIVLSSTIFGICCGFVKFSGSMRTFQLTDFFWRRFEDMAEVCSRV